MRFYSEGLLFGCHTHNQSAFNYSGISHGIANEAWLSSNKIQNSSCLLYLVSQIVHWVQHLMLALDSKVIPKISSVL